MRIDLDKQKREDRNRKMTLVQWHQFAGMLFFLVVNNAYKHNSDDMIIGVMFLISYVVFLATTIRTMSFIIKLYREIPKKEENNEE